MKICFLYENRALHHEGLVPGSQVQMDRLAAEFRRRGHSIVLVAGAQRRVAPVSEVDESKYEDWAERVERVMFRSGRRVSLLAFARAYAALRASAPEVVYARGRSYLTGVAALFAKRHGGVFVWASNGEDGCERWKLVRRLWRRSRPLPLRLLRTPIDAIADLVCDTGIHHADVFVCQTAHQRDRLRAVHGREGTIIRTLQVADRALPARDSPPLILWIGRVVPDRRPEAFVQLAAALTDENCDLALVGPAGRQDYLDRILAPASVLPRFRYIGAVPFEESWDWISRASLLVNTSPVEGISNALVQAWACGTPTLVLSFDPDGLIEREGAGLLSGDIETMARDIRRLLKDREALATCGTRAQALADREFSRAAVGDAYEALIEQARRGR